MARKTRRDRLRGEKRRRQATRKFILFLIRIGIIIGVLALAAYGAWQVAGMRSAIKSLMQGGKAGTYAFSDDYKQVGLGQPFDFAGGKLTLNSLDTTTGIISMFGGGIGNEPLQIHKAERGVWAIVSVTYQGSPYADSGTLDPASARLTDDDGNVYPNQSVGELAEELYAETNTTAFGKIPLASREPKRSLLIFDVSPKAEGLLLAFLRDESGEMKVVRGAKLNLKGAVSGK